MRAEARPPRPPHPPPRAGWPRRVARAAAGLLLTALAALALHIGADLADWPRADDEGPEAGPAAATDAQRARGAQLARIGHCAGCHSARGGAEMAGGRPVATPFGTAYAANLTPDPAALGHWTAADFRRALWRGRSRDGRLLLPACPYPSFTRVTREDADALWAWLRSLPPVAQANPPHALPALLRSTPGLAVWRALYFRPGRRAPDAAHDARWNRGEYLVNGLAHCGACHAGRGPLGGSAPLAQHPGGAAMPAGRWVAPSLADPQGAGLAGWPADEARALLRSGWSRHGLAQGPMAEVVLGSTQHLDDADLDAVVAYLQALPPPPGPPTGPPPGPPTGPPRGTSPGTPPGTPATPPPIDPPADQAAEELAAAQRYRRLCRDCHGPDGQGVPGAYPALAGNRILGVAHTANLVQVLTHGGFAPATAANPRPYGMPPFDLDDADLAALLSHLRRRFAPDQPPLSAREVRLLR